MCQVSLASPVSPAASHASHASLWVWVRDLHTIPAEIAAKVLKPREVGQEALLGGSERGSDREVATTFCIPVAFHKETIHSVRNSRAMAPSWKVIPRARGEEGPLDLGPGT